MFDLLGRTVTLPILRFGSPGAFLALAPEAGARETATILLPGAEIPPDAAVGDLLCVFIYLDSEDRPVATLRSPKLQLDEVAFLEVIDLTKIGAFFDWGLPKQLLVPHAEQTRELRVGERHPIGLYLDDTTRLAGTMKVSEMVRATPDVALGAWVEGEAWRRDPDTGVFVIVERRYVGVLPASEPNRLTRGEAARFRVANILPDGRIELSLRDVAHRAAMNDGEHILEVLARPGTPPVGDRSSPDEIVGLFGISKKAFKRAVGGLLKRGDLHIDDDGHLLLARRAPGRGA